MLTAEERRVVLEVASTVEPHDGPIVDRVLDEYRRRGFASAVGAVDPKISAIALGFRGRSGTIGSVNIIFFRSVFSPNAAAERYLPKLRDCVRTVADLL
jgi:DNA-binding IclR family transcriptional regulator